MNGVIGEMEPWVAAAVVGAAMVTAWALGWRWGQSSRIQGGEAPESKLDEAALALLGLLLAFTFSMALNKYERRREALVSDSNAIGDFYTCASLVPDPVRRNLQAVIRDYTRLRLDLAGQASRATLDAALPRFERMQNRMTELVGEALAAGTPIAVPLTDTLNDVTSSHAARLAAVRDRVPGSVGMLLLVASAMTTVLVGRQQGASPKPSVAGAIIFITIVVLTVYIIYDLDQPDRGLIRVSQEPLQRLLLSMGE